MWHCPPKPQTWWWWSPWLSCSHQRANNNQVKGALVLYNFKTKTQNQVFCKIVETHLHLHGPWKVNTWDHLSVFLNFLHYSCVNVSAIEKSYMVNTVNGHIYTLTWFYMPYIHLFTLTCTILYDAMLSLEAQGIWIDNHP